MFSNISKLDGLTINNERCYCLLIIHRMFQMFRSVYHQFGFLCSQCDMVFMAVVKCKLKEILQKKDIMGEEDHIICLSDCSNFDAVHVNSELGVICSVELLAVVNGVEVTRGDSSLFKPELVVNRTEDFVVPFEECSSVLEAIINIKEASPYSAKEVKLSAHDITYS